MFAALASGHIDLADLFFLLATIFAGIATVVAVVRGAAEAAFVPAAVCFTALGLFVL